MKMTTHKTNFNVECCEEYSQPIHVHFDCPICNKKNVGTSYLCDWIGECIGEEFYCEECYSEFKVVDEETIEEL